MPTFRNTAKWKSAKSTALKVWPSISLTNILTQEELYHDLQLNGYFYDSGAGQWNYHKIEAADKPTPVIMVRVWANGEQVDQAATDLVKQAAAALKWQLVKRSQAYVCRPPKQLEGRVYLEFLPEVDHAR